MQKLFYVLVLMISFSWNNTYADETEALENSTKMKNLGAEAAATGFNSLSLGHLLTSNNSTLSRGTVAAGTMYVGYGVTDDWTVGTSPFIYLNFKATNLNVRYARNISRDERFGFEVEYFKTFGAEISAEKMWREFCSYPTPGEACIRSHGYPEGYWTYKFEVWNGKATYTHQVNATYRASVTGSLFYYIDEDRPFSFRMDPYNKDPYAANLTSLHEFKLNREWYLNMEGGIWGMNYTYPYLHAGATINYQRKSFLVGLGASTTFSPWFPVEKARPFAGYDSRASYHPEVQIQAFF